MSISKSVLVSTSTYDHRTLKTRLPVRSALFKQRTGGLVVRWVTTSEYPLLYVFDFFFLSCRYSPHARGLYRLFCVAEQSYYKPRMFAVFLVA